MNFSFHFTTFHTAAGDGLNSILQLLLATSRQAGTINERTRLTYALAGRLGGDGINLKSVRILLCLSVYMLSKHPWLG